LRPTTLAADFNIEDRASILRGLAPIFFYFLVAGIATVMLGPLLPWLISRWHMQDVQAGTLFTASFAGQLCGSWIAAHYLRASIIYGALLTAIGCTAMAWAGYGAAHVAFFCIGAGLGAGLLAGNVIVGTAIPSIRARLLAILNVAWSLGAIACPILIRRSGQANMGKFFILLSVGLSIASIFAVAIPHAAQTSTDTATSPSELSQKTQAPPLPLALGTMLRFAVVLLLYIGIENALGGWLPSYAIRMNQSTSASSVALYFWIALLLGRLFMSSPISVLGEASVYRGCLVLLLSTQVFLIFTSHLSPVGMSISVFICGLALAPLYPLLLSFVLSRTGSQRNLGPMFVFASLGGATLPWLTGFFSTQLHDLHYGLLIPAVGSLLLMLISVK